MVLDCLYYVDFYSLGNYIILQTAEFFQLTENRKSSQMVRLSLKMWKDYRIRLHTHALRKMDKDIAQEEH